MKNIMKYIKYKHQFKSRTAIFDAIAIVVAWLIAIALLFSVLTKFRIF
jgi:hypothetical protein